MVFRRLFKDLTLKRKGKCRHWRGLFQRALASVTASLVLLNGAGCTKTGTFFGANEDDDVTKNAGYRKVNMACAGLELKSPVLDAPTSRKLISCLNANHAIDPLEKLAYDLKDDELQALADVWNDYAIKNKTLLYQWEATHAALDQKKILAETIQQIGKLFENDELIVSLVSVLREGYYAGEDSSHARSRDKRILKAVELLSTKVVPSKVERALELGLTLGSSKAFDSLQTRFRAGAVGGRTVELIVQNLLQYVQEDSGYANHVFVRELLDALVYGGLLPAIDQVLGEDFEHSVPAFSSSLKFMSDYERDGEAFLGLSTLFHYGHQSISCFKGTKAVPDAVSFAINELLRRPSDTAGDWLIRNHVLLDVSANPFCEFPVEIGANYHFMTDLAESSAMVPTAETLKALSRTNPQLVDLVVRLLADTNGAMGENAGGVRHLAPLLAELGQRHAFDDLVLTASYFTLEDRQELLDLLDFILKPSSVLGGDSIYDVLADNASHLKVSTLARLVRSLHPQIMKDEPVIVPMVNAFRKAYYVNDAHPLIDVTRHLLADAAQREKLFEVIFKISEKDDFQKVVKLVADMARDKRLEDLVSAIVTMFHRFALEGKVEIHERTVPSFVPQHRHNLHASELAPYEPGSSSQLESPVREACKHLDFNLRMDQYDAPGYDEQLQNFLTCLNNDGSQNDVVSAIEFLRATRLENGKSLFAFNVDLIKAMDLNAREMDFVTDRLLEKIDSGRLSDVLKAVPYWTIRSLQGGEGQTPGPLLRPLLDLAAPIMNQARPNQRRLQEYGAKVLRRDDIPELMGYFSDLNKLKPEPGPSPELDDFDIERISRWVGNKECERYPHHDGRLRRATEIVHEYKDQVTNWELVEGKPRMRWEKDEFKKQLEPVFQKIADPSSGIPERSVLDAMMNVLRYFTLKPGDKPNSKQHWGPEYLVNWFRDRSNDYRLITYYYPGDEFPRVRLVNTLDRLELVLINADFPAPPPLNKNFGMQFLADIGEAWGDEPRSSWPEDIQRKFPEGGKSRPRTLSEAVNHILQFQQVFENMVGYPDLPGCNQVANPQDPKSVQERETTDPHSNNPTGLPNWMPVMDVKMMKASLFNTRQVISVLTENLPGSGTPQADGLKVLRNLFFEFYYSSPEKYRSAKAGWNNNLSVVMRLVRMGLTRQIGRGLRALPPEDQSVHDIFGALITGSVSDGVKPLLNTLLADDPKHELIWKVVDGVFNILNAAEGRELTPERAKKLEGKSEQEKQEIIRGWAQDSARSKQLTYYALATSHQLGLIAPLIQTAGPILHEYREYLTQQAGILEDALTVKGVSYLLRALYEDGHLETKAKVSDLAGDALSDPQRGLDLMAVVKAVKPEASTITPITVFLDRLSALDSIPEYKSLDMEEFAQELWDFFSERSPSSSGVETAHRLRFYLAERLESGDLDQLMLVARDKPEDFYRVLRTLGNHSGSGDLEEYLRTIRRAVVDTSRR